MANGAAMIAAKNGAKTRVSVALTSEILNEVSARAEKYSMSLNRTILQLLRAGLEAERQKKQHLEEMLREYRECADPREAERLGDELGAMIFGR
jgi:metal-responsive CopG/Arc/MetJ family transcriptional regulator